MNFRESMKLETIVHYKGGLACFQINREAPGLYVANLLYFEGADANAPPSEITLIRGIRTWAGSVDDDILLNNLGYEIELDLMEHH